VREQPLEVCEDGTIGREDLAPEAPALSRDVQDLTGHVVQWDADGGAPAHEALVASSW
jgi:hypothetical protein